jgi:hypothetical protein
MTDVPSIFRRIYGYSGWRLRLELEVELNATAVPHQRGVVRAGKDRCQCSQREQDTEGRARTNVSDCAHTTDFKMH